MSALINLSLRVDKLPKEKFVQGNGSVVWTDNNINVATKKEVEAVEAGDDLPF